MTIFQNGDRVRLTSPLWAEYVASRGESPHVGDVVTITESGYVSGGYFKTAGGAMCWVSGASGAWSGELVVEATDREPVKISDVTDAALLEIRNLQARTLGYTDGLLDRTPITMPGADPAYDLGYQEGYTARVDLDT